jgi:phosphatidate cytidylyltransferase
LPLYITKQIIFSNKIILHLLYPMTKPMNTLMQRTLTGVVFVASVIFCTLASPVTLTLLFLAFTVVCLWEFLNLTVSKNENRFLFRRRVIGIALGVASFLLIILQNYSLNLPNVKYIIYVAVFLMFLFEMFSNAQTPFQNMSFIVLGLIYIAVPFALLVNIAVFGGLFAPWRVLGLVFLVWANDSFAYLIGSKIGKTPLFPRVSPKKTWEGTIGGALCTVLFAYLLSFFIDEYNLQDWLIMSVIVGVFGTLGDLVESMFKRSLHVKDSGSFLPGHGGFLDRMDAVIFVVPFIILYLHLANYPL